jgi:hypothetical protein
MQQVQLVDSDINAEKLKADVFKLLNDHKLFELQQVSLTSISGDDDWQCSVGKIHLLDRPERFYSTINKSLHGSYIEELINRYPKYYRWRLLRLLPRETYTVHADSNNQKANYRLHIPVVTNDQAYLSFCTSVPKNKSNVMFYFEHLEVGNSYMVDTTNYHTAVNYGSETRYHIVGVRYENSNNRSH